jgi:hypothetical protein
VAFALWAGRLGRPRPAGARPTPLDALEADVDTLRRELSETQERIDFAERLLAQRRESRPVDPPR